MEIVEELSVQEVYDYTARLVVAGKSDAEIERELVEKGLAVEDAAVVTQNMRNQFQEAYKEQAISNMRTGGLWFLGGSLVTGGTYYLASEQGGSYFMTWGAIIFGGFQFLQGAYQYMKNN
ncbi:hypothetical protein MTX78_03655 [Hymenobacter tibetensis]|uniref:Uncharacterized protein n=1 Tax=Hymenobacter tibetensis TaxID=497967 RepID=A0ABY4CZK0_9BACT|nr:hypothetical protein [Hymenobacter tibetensis]UOG75695.1 hypothetical protein MTX78_03655 [Hymenobacter tibetensis]